MGDVSVLPAIHPSGPGLHSSPFVQVAHWYKHSLQYGVPSSYHLSGHIQYSVSLIGSIHGPQVSALSQVRHGYLHG